MPGILRATILLLVPAAMNALPVSPLYLRGYTVIPEPQKVELKSADFEFGGSWGMAFGPGAGDVAVESLKEQLAERYELNLDPRAHEKVIELAIQRGAVQIGDATDPDKAALAEQAYELRLSPARIRITANAPAGLFYGVETLVQLVKPERGRLLLP